MTLLNRETINILPWCVKLEIAADVMPELNRYRNKRGRINFNDPYALNLYNRAVAKTIANLDIQVPHGNLIPTICLRQAYLVCLAESLLPRNARILEIGTGASAVIGMLAARLYSFEVIATEIDERSITSAQQNITRNQLDDQIQLLLSSGEIIKGLVEHYGPFDAVLTYPPTYPEHDAARFEESSDRGFQGTVSEMIGGGPEGFDFIKRYLLEAIEVSHLINLISIMLIFQEHVGPACALLEDAAFEVRVIQLLAGRRTRYLILAKKSNTH